MKKYFCCIVLSVFSTGLFAQSITIFPNGRSLNKSDQARLNLWSTGIPEILSQKSLGTFELPIDVTNNNNLLQINASGYIDGAFSAPKARIRFSTSNAWSTTSQGTKIDFLTTADDETTMLQRMRITGAGMVGIGTDSPNARLSISHESNTANPTLILNETSNTGASQVQFSQSGTSRYWELEAKSTNTINDNYFKITPSNLTSGFFIRGDGNVGINNIEPDTKLHVGQGNLKVDNVSPKVIIQKGTDLSIEPAILQYQESNGTAVGGLAYFQNKLNLYRKTLLEGIVIDSLDHIGINFTNPAYNLHVKNEETSSGTTGSMSIGGINVPHLNLDNDEIDAYSAVNGSGALYLNSNSGGDVQVGGAANSADFIAMNQIGIQTTHPDYPLQISSSNEASGSTSGVVSIGTPNAIHMNIDGNEIDSYNLNAGNKLFLQANSDKDTEVGGGGGDLIVANYTQLGASAPKIKQKLIETTTSSNPTTTIAHGLVAADILAVDIHIDIAGEYYPSDNSDFEKYYNYFYNSTSIVLATTIYVQNKNIKILITYRE